MAAEDGDVEVFIGTEGRGEGCILLFLLSVLECLCIREVVWVVRLVVRRLRT